MSPTRRPSLRYTLPLGVAALLGISVAIAALRHHKALQRWEAVAAQATAEGMELRREAYLPKHVPDAENFLAAPVFIDWLVDKTTWDAEVKKLEAKPLGAPEEAEGKRASFTQSPLHDWSQGKPFSSEAWDAYLGYPLVDLFARHEAVLAGISEAAQCPALYSVFKAKTPGELTTPCVFLLFANKLYKLRALYALQGKESGEATQTQRGKAALDDLFTTLRLSRYANEEKTYLSLLVRISLCIPLQQVIATGLSTQQWTSEEITSLQDKLEGIHPLEETMEHFAGELTYFLENVEYTLTPAAYAVYKEQEDAVPALPLPWLHNATLRKYLLLDLRTATLVANNKAHYVEFKKQHLPACVDTKETRVHLDAVALLEQELETERETASYDLAISLSAHKLIPNLLTKAAYFQTWRDQAVLACALERYRLWHGAYPKKLSALVPEFCAKLPHDVITGEPLRYQVADGKNENAPPYTLYSVGWNGTDDGGKVVFKENSPTASKEGDWVWQLPPVEP